MRFPAQRTTCEFNLNLARADGKKSNVKSFYFSTCNFTCDETAKLRKFSYAISLRCERETRWRLTLSRSPPRAIPKKKKKNGKLRKMPLFAPRKKRGPPTTCFEIFRSAGKISISLTIATTNTCTPRIHFGDARARFLVPESRPGNTVAPETKAIPARGTPRRELLYDFWANDLNNFRAAAPAAEFCKTDLQLSRGNREPRDRVPSFHFGSPQR